MSRRQRQVLFSIAAILGIILLVLCLQHTQPTVATSAKDYSFTERTGASPQQNQPVTLSRWAGAPVIVIFWRADCPPCVKELSLLPTIAKQNAPLPILLISLQDDAQSRPLPTLPDNVHILTTRADGRALLIAFGNDRTLALPYSVMLDGKGVPCSKQYGIINPDTISEGRKQCSLAD